MVVLITNVIPGLIHEGYNHIHALLDQPGRTFPGRLPRSSWNFGGGPMVVRLR
jgi:hypothetical protein